MKKMQNLGLVAAGALLALATSSAGATEYTFTYTQVGETYLYGSPASATTTDATGTLIVEGNAVTSGTLVVTGYGAGTYTLIPSSGSDSLIQYDNVWPIDTTAGLAWSKSGSAYDPNEELNIWSTGPGNGPGEYGQPGGYYALWGGPGTINNQSFNVETYGTFSYADPGPLTAPAPDGGLTAGLLGGALLGLGALRRKFVA